MLVQHTSGIIRRIPGKLPKTDTNEGVSILVADVAYLPPGWSEYIPEEPPTVDPETVRDQRIEANLDIIVACIQLGQQAGYTEVPEDNAVAVAYGMQLLESANLDQVKAALLLKQARDTLYELGGVWGDVVWVSQHLEQYLG